jgi:ketosteroid isomerase-like protein
MKKVFPLAFALCCCLLNAVAQNAQQEINEQVWKPFIKSFNEYDTKGFMAVHSKDVIRSSRDSKMVLNWDEYFSQQEKGDLQGNSSGSKRQLELRFNERLASKDQAVEVGVYKTTSIKKDGIAKSFYGRFHVVLRKENGTWKILVDTDSSEGNSITEKEFLEAIALE